MIRIPILILIFVISLFSSDEQKYVNLIKPMILKIENLKDDIITIPRTNLEIGRSGIVVHVYENKEKIVLANAKVISSNDKESKIKIFEFNGLYQDSIPTTKRKVVLGDILVLSYLYDKSIVITPNVDTFTEVKKRFLLTSFLHPDIFGARLKIDNGLYPKKEDIQKFAIKQNIGTIFIVVNKKIYVLDSKTFKTLISFDIEYDNTKKYKMPFYTRIEKIDSSITGISFSDDEMAYEKHYKKLLGIK